VGSPEAEAQGASQPKLKHGGIGDDFSWIVPVSNCIHHGLEISMQFDLDYGMGPDFYPAPDIPGEFGDGIGGSLIVMEIGYTYPNTSANIRDQWTRGGEILIKVQHNVIQGSLVVTNIGLTHIIVKRGMCGLILIRNFYGGVLSHIKLKASPKLSTAVNVAIVIITVVITHGYVVLEGITSIKVQGY
jgi:hypothetical protein